MSESITIELGSHFTVGETHFEVTGQVPGRAVATPNADRADRSGIVPVAFPLDGLMERVSFSGPYGEALPYSKFVRERAAWCETFGTDIEVTEPPVSLVRTIEAAKRRGIDCLDAHFLPGGQLTPTGILIGKAVRPYPAGWEPFDEVFYSNYIGAGFVGAEVIEFPREWVLFDRTRRVAVKQGNAEWLTYPEDKLAAVTEKIRFKNNLPVGQFGDRTGIPSEILVSDMPEVLWQTITDKGEHPMLDQAVIGLPSLAEFSVLMNMFHPHPDDDNFGEWLNNVLVRIGDGWTIRLVTFGPVSNIAQQDPTKQDKMLGYRPIIRFPVTESRGK